MMKNILVLLVILFFVLFWSSITLVFDVKLFQGVTGQLRALRYPSTSGRVLSSEIHTNPGDSESAATYRADIRYAYSVDGRNYTGNRYRYEHMASSDNHADQIQAAHPVGADVIVYYNPDDPADAVLKTGIEGVDLFLALFMTPFNLVMFAGWLMVAGAVRNLLQRREAGGIPITEAGQLTRVRLHHQSPLAAAAVVAGLIAFVSIFIIGFIAGFHPSLPVASLPWIVMAFASAKAWLKVNARNQSGEEDLLIDRMRQLVSFASLPDPEKIKQQDLKKLIDQLQQSRLPERISLSHSEITAIEMEVILPADSDDSASYIPIIHWRRSGATMKSCLAVWSDREKTEAFIAWLRQKLGLYQSENQ